MSSVDSAAPSDALSRDELKRRATGGMFVVSSWGLVNLLVGFGGNLVLARLLLPRDFGLVAIGATLMVFATTLADGGLGSGLIRRPNPPSRDELRAVLALQLTVTVTLGVVAAAIASQYGEAGLIVAVMMVALPVASFQTPGRVMLSRSLLFQRLAVGDATGIAFYYAWSIAGVVAGFGVWALATGAVVRALAASVVLTRLSGVGMIAPTFRGARALAPVIRFGIAFQAVSFTNVGRDQSVNAVTAAVAGVSALGLWTLARRLLEVPLLLFESLWRVSFPVMSQVLGRRDDPGPLIERSLAGSVIAAGLMLTFVAGAATELVPVLFGEQWRESGAVLALSCLPLLISGPVSVSTIGYLYASGETSVVLRASLVQTAAVLAISVPLLASIGVLALPIGWCAGALLEAVILGRATTRLCGARILRPIAAPFALAVAGGAFGVWLAQWLGPGFLAGVAGGAAGAALYLVGALLLRRDEVADLSRVIRQSFVAATTRRPREGVVMAGVADRALPLGDPASARD